MRFTIDWASLQWEGNLPFSLPFRGQFPSTSPPGGLYSKGDSRRVFCVTILRGGGGLYLEGLIHGGAYFRNFTVIPKHLVSVTKFKTLFLSVTGFSGPQKVSFSLKA